jgi:enoyl-CoA hydratase/carnithine racemase
MTIDTNEVLFEERDQAVWITINRDAKRNALNRNVASGIAEGIRRASAIPSVRVIVLTGAGDRAFCAGADLEGSASFFEFDYSQSTNPYSNLLRTGMACTLPMIARINGHCLAGGMGLPAICDLAVSVDSARFGLPEVKVGVFPMQVLTVLQGIIPQRKLSELCITGEPVSAMEALEMGFLNYVVPKEDLDAKVMWLARRIIDKSRTAIRRGKWAARAVADMSFDQAISYMESAVGTLSLTEDAQEGIRAFREKREPRFVGI